MLSARLRFSSLAHRTPELTEVRQRHPPSACDPAPLPTSTLCPGSPSSFLAQQRSPVLSPHPHRLLNSCVRVHSILPPYPIPRGFFSFSLASVDGGGGGGGTHPKGRTSCATLARPSCAKHDGRRVYARPNSQSARWQEPAASRTPYVHVLWQ